MAWILLVAAGVFEVIWSFFMKQSQGFTKITPTVLTLLTVLASFGLLSMAMKTLPLGTAYTIWTGIGATGAFLVGIIVLGERATLARVIAAGLMVSGMLLMKLSSPN